MYEEMYRLLYLIRYTEEEVARIYPTDKIRSPVHLSIGQEAVAVGAIMPLLPDDVVFGTYRSHASYIAKGGNLKRMWAELYGKGSGIAKGKGGSMHLVDASKNIMGTSAVVGTTIANSIGYAYALKYQKSHAVVASFFGDGGSEEGVFHESMNWAALKKLPIIFVCENNQYAIHTHITKRHVVPTIADRVRHYGFPVSRIEDMDVIEIYKQVRAVVHALRSGEANGPFFFEVETYRWKEHVGPGEDYQVGYRSEDELHPWQETDQVTRIGAMVDDGVRQEIEKSVEKEVADAIQFAEESDFPALEELYTDIYA